MICPKCNKPMRFISAGISKNTGRKYPAFWSCGCGYTFTPKNDVKEVKFEQDLEEDKQNERWDLIGRNKTRCALAEALIRRGSKFSPEIKKELDDWTRAVFGESVEEKIEKEDEIPFDEIPY